jgi:hypothetical protein
MIKGMRYLLQYNRAKKIIQEAGITDRDFFLVSFPKSGNTWLRFILANALYSEKDLALENINDLLPTMHRSTAEEMKKLPSPRFIKTHDAFFSLYEKVIYIVRDYRDVVVSAYFHAKNRGVETGDISFFIQSGVINSFGPWHWHVKEALTKKENDPANFLLIRYEDLQLSPVEHIRTILSFCNITSSLDAAAINERTAFAKLRKAENERNGDLEFFREGKSGDWKNHLSPSDLEFLLDERTKLMMTKLAYDIEL